jgi:hypothetical protein
MRRLSRIIRAITIAGTTAVMVACTDENKLLEAKGRDTDACSAQADQEFGSGRAAFWDHLMDQCMKDKGWRAVPTEMGTMYERSDSHR